MLKLNKDNMESVFKNSIFKKHFPNKDRDSREVSELWKDETESGRDEEFL